MNSFGVQMLDEDFRFWWDGSIYGLLPSDCDNVDYQEAENGTRGSDSFTNGNDGVLGVLCTLLEVF